MEINKDSIKNPDVGAIAEVINDLGTGATIILGIVAGTTMALNVTTFGIPAFVGAAVAAVTFTVGKVGKASTKSKAKKLKKNVEVYIHSYLRCIITDVAKELSYMFEYQVVQLGNETEIDKLADCAVELMLDLKKKEKFDRNTLLQKVLQDGNANESIELRTKNGDKWKAPDVFRKPGLRKVMVTNDRLEFTYHVKKRDSCDTNNYGYRSQFLEMKESWSDDRNRTPSADEAPAYDVLPLSEECSHTNENCIVGYCFVDSAIDSQYSLPRSEDAPYHPIHILLRNPGVLDDFAANRPKTGKPSLAKFVKEKIENLPKNHLVFPVFRPNVPGNIPSLQNSDLKGSDFGHSNFRNSYLMSCDLTNCVMLFANLRKANMSGSTFNQTLISYSDLAQVDATRCKWIKTSILYSLVDDMDISEMQNNGNISWSGTDTSSVKMEQTPISSSTTTTTTNKNQSKYEQILLNA